MPGYKAEILDCLHPSSRLPRCFLFRDFRRDGVSDLVGTQIMAPTFALVSGTFGGELIFVSGKGVRCGEGSSAGCLLLKRSMVLQRSSTVAGISKGR